MNHIEQCTFSEINNNLYRKKKFKKNPKLLKKKENEGMKKEGNCLLGKYIKECVVESKELTQYSTYLHKTSRNIQTQDASKKQQIYKLDPVTLSNLSTLPYNANQESTTDMTKDMNIQKKNTKDCKRNQEKPKMLQKGKKKTSIYMERNITQLKFKSTMNIDEVKKRYNANTTTTTNNRIKKKEKTKNNTLSNLYMKKKQDNNTSSQTSNNYNISIDQRNVSYYFSYSKFSNKNSSLERSSRTRTSKESNVPHDKKEKPSFKKIKKKKDYYGRDKPTEKKTTQNNKNQEKNTLEGILKNNKSKKKTQKKKVRVEMIVHSDSTHNATGKKTSFMMNSKSEMQESVETYLLNFCKNSSSNLSDYNNVYCFSNRSTPYNNVILTKNHLNAMCSNNHNSTSIVGSSSNVNHQSSNSTHGNPRILEPRGYRRVLFNEESHYSELDVYIDEYRGSVDHISSNDNDAIDMEPIHIACKEANRPLIQQLLMHGVDVNCKTQNRQFSPLHFAASKGNLDCVQLLVKHNANINSKSIDGETPLWCASITNNVEICKYLIEKGAALNGESKVKYDSALHAASMMGSFEIVTLLIESGAKINCLDGNFLEPIQYAAFEGHKGIVKYLLRKQIEESLKHRMQSVVEVMKQYTSHNENLEMQYYLKCKSILKKRITSKVLCCAITSGNTKMVDIILKGGADPNYFDVRLQLFPIHASAITGNVAIFKKLVKRGANIFMKTTCNNLPIDLTEDKEIKQYIMKQSRKINLKNAFLIRMKTNNHIITYLSNDLFFHMCTFF